MPKPPLPERALALLREANPAVIAVQRPDGHPMSVATWYLIEVGQSTGLQHGKLAAKRPEDLPG